MLLGSPGLAIFGAVQRSLKLQGVLWRICCQGDLRAAGHWPIVTWRQRLGEPQERTMSHQPPKTSKKKAAHTAKEKKTIKQQKKHAGDAAPFLKH